MYLFVIRARDPTLRISSYLTLWYAAVLAYIKLRHSLILHFPTSLQKRSRVQYPRAVDSRH